MKNQSKCLSEQCGGELAVEAAMAAEISGKMKMANTPSPKLFRRCNHVEEVEGDVAQRV